MTITHIVLFEFKSTASQPEIESVCRRMLALKEECRQRGSGERYILSARGGRNCSVEEDLKASSTHGFVLEFANDADRMYYINEDPAHQTLVQSLEEVVTRVSVVDFVPGEF